MLIYRHDLTFIYLAIAIHRPADVRPILKAYAGKDVALEYGKFEAEMKQKALDEWEKSGKKRSAVEGVSIGRLFGGVSGRCRRIVEDAY